MKILFTAFSISHGLGGHTRSMYQVKELMAANGHSCRVLLIGPSDIPHEFHTCEYYISLGNTGFIGFKKQLGEILSDYVPQLIHSFDEYSFLLTQFAKPLPRLLTRCGGPNPKGYPFAPVITLFSAENLEYFQSLKKLAASDFRLIPQRASRFESDASLVDKLSKKIERSENDIVLLRIGRISTDYEMTIRQSVELHYLFSQHLKDRQVKLIILGAVYDKPLLEDLENECASVNDIYFVTDHEYVKEAKKVIDIADIVIGTGRGFMEGASQGKIMFVPLKGAKLPALITRGNIEAAFRFNFSERVVLPQKLITPIHPEQIIDQRKLLEQESAEIFEEYFNIETAALLYQEAYNEVLKLPPFSNTRLDIFKNYLYCKYLLFRYA